MAEAVLPEVTDEDMASIALAWRRVFPATALRAGVDAPAASAAMKALVAAYNEPGRHYHNMVHVAECARQALIAHDRGDWTRPHTALSALLFHDAVYDVRSHDNEEKSAALALRVLQQLLPVTDLEDKGARVQMAEVERLILLTKHSAVEPSKEDADGQLLLDIDLSVLGADAVTFEAYDRAIRKEYIHVPPDAYRAGRAAVLRGFLARPRIFLTERYAAEREAAARMNLEQAIARLENPRIPLADEEEPNVTAKPQHPGSPAP